MAITKKTLERSPYVLKLPFKMADGTQSTVAMTWKHILEVHVHKEKKKDILSFALTEVRQPYHDKQKPIVSKNIGEGTRPAVALVYEQETPYPSIGIIMHESAGSKHTIEMKMGGVAGGSTVFAKPQIDRFTDFSVMGNTAASEFTKSKDQDAARKLYEPAVAASSNGCVVVCKTEKNQLVASTFSRDYGGATGYHLTYKNTVVYGQGRQPAIAMDASGVVLTVYQSVKDAQLWLRIGYNYWGKIHWSEQVATGAFGNNPSVVLDNSGNAQLAYISGGLVCVRQIKFYSGAAVRLDTDPGALKEIQISEEFKYDIGSSVSIAGYEQRLLLTFQHDKDQIYFTAVDHDSDDIYEFFNDNYNWKHERWMNDSAFAIRDRPLNQLLIPGTHDSGTYAISMTSTLAPEQDLPQWVDLVRMGFGVFGYMAGGAVIAGWAKSQGLNILQQLKAGIRYFDLRVVKWLAVDPVTNKSSSEFYLCHSMYSANIDALLADVKAFTDVRANEREIIILDFNHLYNMTKADHDKLIAKVKKAFGGKIARKGLTPQSRLSDFWAAKTQIVVIYHDYETTGKNEDIWDAGSIYSPWQPEVQNEKDLLQRLDSKLKARDKGDSGLFVSQGILNPDGAMIGKGLVPFTHDPGSLKQVGKKITPSVTAWVKKNKAANINIVIVDWFNFSRDYVDVIRQANVDK